MQKTIIIGLLLISSVFTANSQINFGVKAGLNYNNFGDGALSQTTNDLISGAENKTGYHIGVFIKAKLAAIGLYVRPEFVYTQLKTDYAWNSGDAYKGDFELSKIDVPILVGTKIIGPLHAFIGPAFQFVVDSDFKASDVSDIDTDAFSLGIQMGFGIELGKLGIDVRWERGLSDTESKITRSIAGSENVVIDTRPNQIIFGLSYRFGKK